MINWLRCFFTGHKFKDAGCDWYGRIQRCTRCGEGRHTAFPSQD